MCRWNLNNANFTYLHTHHFTYMYLDRLVIVDLPFSFCTFKWVTLTNVRDVRQHVNFFFKNFLIFNFIFLGCQWQHVMFKMQMWACEQRKPIYTPPEPTTPTSTFLSFSFWSGITFFISSATSQGHQSWAP